MSRYSGRQSEVGSVKVRGNKGVARSTRLSKRVEAELRQKAYNAVSPEVRRMALVARGHGHAQR